MKNHHLTKPFTDQNATTTELLLIRVLPVNDLPEIVMPNYLPNTTNITGIVIHEDHTVFPYEGILLSDPDSADQPRGKYLKRRSGTRMEHCS